ncbi:hypothetical protein ANN_18646 [Periplaneta americana]|uniref:Uncharacterized protein n=1 Tax=Periplaneta americana TaxID=6978 RepID=A0ABQ8SRF1_PERAM|nr:hypothetical protein ANN_18646 [Periplaneta americana]
MSCETWTLTLREEQGLRVFENKVLRKIFGAKRDEVTGEWRKLHNAELQALYSSSDIIRNIKSRRFRWAEHVARMGESRNAYRVLVGRPEGNRPLGRPRRRWEDNIKMDLREVGYDWTNLTQDRDQWQAYVRAAKNLRISNVRNENPAVAQQSDGFLNKGSRLRITDRFVTKALWVGFLKVPRFPLHLPLRWLQPVRRQPGSFLLSMSLPQRSFYYTTFALGLRVPKRASFSMAYCFFRSVSDPPQLPAFNFNREWFFMLLVLDLLLLDLLAV